jgi:hypothetical protein
MSVPAPASTTEATDMVLTGLGGHERGNRQPVAIYQATLNADRLNVSDPRAAALAARLDDVADIAITYGTFNAEPYIGELDTTYQQLMACCGQLVQGSHSHFPDPVARPASLRHASSSGRRGERRRRERSW